MALDFGVIVIGSGFGAAVAAIDQAGKGKTVFILERGVWWLIVRRESDEPIPKDATSAILAAAGPPPRASRLSGGCQSEWGSGRAARFCQRRG